MTGYMTRINDLLDIEHEFWKANLAGDSATFDRLLRDDALGVSPWGVADKSQVVALIKANENPYHAYEISEPRLVELTDESAVLTYKVHVEGSRGDTPFTIDFFATSAYVDQDGTWLGAFSQFTTPAPPQA
jgi:hypothetical protein